MDLKVHILTFDQNKGARINLPRTQGSPATPNLGRRISKSTDPISMKQKNHFGKCMDFLVLALRVPIPSFSTSISQFTKNRPPKNLKKKRKIKKIRI